MTNTNHTATCRTCGVSGPPWHHVPSVLDPEGIGDPGHKMPADTNHTDRDELDTIIDNALKLIRPVIKPDNGTGIMHMDSARLMLKQDIQANYIPKPSPTKSSGELENLLGSIDADFGYAVGNLNMDTTPASRADIIAKIEQWHATQTAKLQAEARVSEAKYITEHAPKFYSLQEKDKWFDNRVAYLEKEYGVEGNE